MLEIERKFLVADPGIVAGLEAERLAQGYLGRIGGFHLRVRLAIDPAGGRRAWLTLKSDAPGIAREEREAEMSPDLAARLLATLPERHRIEKLRHHLPAEGLPGFTWVIDRFLGRHEGLWLAEIELDRADRAVALPAWLGAEVTDDPRYRNAALAEAPEGPPPQDEALAPLLAGLLAAKSPAADDRAARLAQQLRANLSRRKAQSRARNEAREEARDDAPPSVAPPRLDPGPDGA